MLLNITKKEVRTCEYKNKEEKNDSFCSNNSAKTHTSWKVELFARII